MAQLCKQWILEYWCGERRERSLEDWFDHLTEEQFKSIAKELKLLELCGNKLRLPHSRALGKGLFELREQRFGYRMYYTFLQNNIVLLLEAGNKTTQKSDIEVARYRLSKIVQSKRGLL